MRTERSVGLSAGGGTVDVEHSAQAGPGSVRFEALPKDPLVVRFEIGWRCDHGSGPDRGRPQFYLGVNQAF